MGKMNTDYLDGVFLANRRGFGFVRVEGIDEDFFIPAKYTMHAFHQDRVRIIPGERTGQHTEARIIRILGHELREVIGVMQVYSSYGFLTPRDKRIARDIYISKEELLGAVTGSLAVVEITSYGSETAGTEGRVKEVIGHIDDPASDILLVVKAYGIPVDFPEEVEHELRQIPSAVSENDLAGRTDFRDWETVTIDGEDAKDLDDAITLSKTDNGYLLGVHIADVTHYVKEGSPLDKEALKRGTSNYLVDSVIPMLPHQLSNGICSLNAGEDRLTLSVIMEIDRKGNIISHELTEGVIRVNERMNYTDVFHILERSDEAALERYKALVPLFDRMGELSEILRAKRVARGGIDFDVKETKIVVDENHRPVDIMPYERNAADLIIEDFMLAANEAVAEDAYWQNIPFEYRIHEAPAPDKIETLETIMKGLGLSFRCSRDNLHPKEIQRLLGLLSGQPYEAFLSRLVLRSMQQARYSTACEGHFGLACRYYCHFTSPIRRYPDLQIHRILKENLHGRLDEDRQKHYAGILPAVAKDNSEKERRAVDAEREADRMKEIEFMSGHLGEVFEGTVSGFTSQNIFVELDNTVEGFFTTADMTDDVYEYEEKALRMKGKRTGRVIRLGDRTAVQVVSADKASREIRFILTEEDAEENTAGCSTQNEMPDSLRNAAKEGGEDGKEG